MSTQPTGTAPTAKNPSLRFRVATREDAEQIVDVAQKAFVHDPEFLYFGDVSEITETGIPPHKYHTLRQFVAFLLNACWLADGRVVVVEDESTHKVVSAAYYLPPNKRFEAYHLRLMWRSGIVGVLKGWGITGLKRVAIEYQDNCHAALERAFKKRSAGSIANSWYLLLAMTLPEYQGQGAMSTIIREAFTHGPNDIFVLEATTAKSRDQYAHLGYELQETITMGKGKVNAAGLPAKGEDAVGVKIYSMIRWKGVPDS